MKANTVKIVRSLLLLALALSGGALFAQTIPVNPRIGKISPEECEMSVYPLDTAAAAVVLYEEHAVRIDYDPALGLPRQWIFHRERIKILKEEAKDRSDYSLLLSRRADEMETLPTLSVVTYNLENGKVVATKMPKSNVFRTKYNDNYDKVTFAAQNVRAGSVIEVRCDKTTGRFSDIDDFYFQREIPVNLCVYSVSLPRWLQFNKVSRGTIPFTIKESSEGGTELGSLFPGNTLDVSEYTAVDVPALDREPGLYCPRQYRSSLSINVSGLRFPGLYRDYSETWEDVDKQVRESSIMTRIKASCRFKDEVDAALNGLESAQDKLAAIIALVRGKVEWDKTYRLVPSDGSDALRTRSGSSADINALVASAARYAGFDVAPVLIRCRPNGALLEYQPDTGAFDKFILRFIPEDGKPLYVDAADPDGWFNVLNDNDLVPKARVIPIEGEGSWVDLTALSRNVTNYYVEARLEPDGTLAGDCRINYLGCPSYEYKEAYRSYDTEEKLADYLEEEFSAEIEDIRAEEVKVYGPQSALHFHFEKRCDAAGDVVYVNPFLEKFHTEALFRLPDRKLPVDFPYPEQIIYVLKLTLPEGYVVDQLPERRRIASGLPSSVSVSAVEAGGAIQLTYRFDLGTMICLPQDYAVTRDYWNTLCGVYDQMIVVKKS